MNLVACRYNPNHKMKPSRREIHEQKCPDRFNPNKKTCPYNPLHIIDIKDYESHKMICENKPDIKEDSSEKKTIKKISNGSDSPTEREQILYAREKYYKGCIKEDRIIGLPKKKNKKKKKLIQDIGRKINETEGKQMIKGMEKDNEDNSDDHNLDNFEEDDNFEFENTDNLNLNKKLNSNMCNVKFKYDPNDEDTEIGKYSANVIDVDFIEETLG